MVIKGVQPSDSGTDLNESCGKQDSEEAWQKFWAMNGETIIWKSWIAKYSAYINPEYLEYNNESVPESVTDTNNAHNAVASGYLCDLNSKQSDHSKPLKFSFDKKEIDEFTADNLMKHNQADGSLVITAANLVLKSKQDSSKRQEVTLKNRVLVRNLSNSDSYDKLHTDISEGWNPLSPLSIECDTEAERLLSSRCGSHASSSFRTLDSMTNVTRMTVSSVDLSQSSKQSDSFSSVSSIQSSLSSSISDEIQGTEYEEQWNDLWKKHYEQVYLKQYKKFILEIDTNGIESK